MNHFLNYILGSLLILLLCSPLGAFVRRKSITDVSNQLRVLDRQMSTCLKEQNRWGYSIFQKPDMFDSGLTYWIKGYVVLTNRRITSFEEAEKLYTELYKDYFRDANAICCVRPFFNTFPLTPPSCELIVAFEDEKGNALLPPYITSMYMEDDCLLFIQHIDLHGVAGSPYEPVFKKSVEEIPALKELYSPSVPRRSLGVKQEIPPFSELCWKDDTPAGRFELDFARKFCKENDLEIVTFGCVGKHYFDARDFDFALCGSQNLNLEQARKMAIKCCNEFFNCEQGDQHIVEYIKTRWRPMKEAVPPLVKQLGFRISFWDDNLDRVVSPNIAEIRFLDGKFTFYIADENQVLKLVHEEMVQDLHPDTNATRN